MTTLYRKIEGPKISDEEKARRAAEQAERLREVEEDRRLAVPRTIDTLRKEAAEKMVEADRLAGLLVAFPDIRKYTGRWNKVAYYSKTANTQVNDFDSRHNCGCCVDSPLEIWPYVETPHGRVYADPPMFSVGERDPNTYGDRPNTGWDTQLRNASIPEAIIERVSHLFQDEDAENEDEESGE